MVDVGLVELLREAATISGGVAVMEAVLRRLNLSDLEGISVPLKFPVDLAGSPVVDRENRDMTSLDILDEWPRLLSVTPSPIPDARLPELEAVADLMKRLLKLLVGVGLPVRTSTPFIKTL